MAASKKHAKRKHRKSSKKTKRSQEEIRMSADEEKLIKEGLEAIYGTEQANLSEVERAKGRFGSILMTIVVTLFVVALLSWSGFYFYAKYFQPTNEDTLELSINAPESLISGEEVQLIFSYNNLLTVPLANLELDLRVPTNLEITEFSQQPDDIEDLTWQLGDIAGGADGEIIITGLWRGHVPSTDAIQAFATYRPSNFNAEFQEIETIYLSTQSSTVDARMSGPEDIIAGEIAAYELEVENTGETAWENLDIHITFPEGFYLEDSSVDIQAGEAPLVSIEHLDAKSTAVIRFEGTFASDVSGFQYFDVDVKAVEGNLKRSQAVAQAFTDVTGTDTRLQLVVNGSSDTVAVSLGSTMRVSLSIENTGEEPLEAYDLLLDFTYDNDVPVNWSDALLDGGEISSEGISWSFEDEDEPLEPNTKHLINLSIPIENTIVDGMSDQLSVTAELRSTSGSVRATPIVIGINSDITLEGYALYFNDEGAPLGSGPIPPQVDETTSYRLYWELQNSLHDLNDVRISAIVPPHVEIGTLRSADLGTLSYDDSSRTLTWTIVSVPNTIPVITANIEASITPTEDDLGSFVQLLSASTLQATDAVTDTSLQATTQEVTTDLTRDSLASDQGVVVD